MSIHDDAEAARRGVYDLLIDGYVQQQTDDAAAVARAKQRATEAEQETAAVQKRFDDHMLEKAPAGHPTTDPEPPPPPPPPPPPLKTTLFGTSYGGADESKNHGRADVARLFWRTAFLPDNVTTDPDFKEAWDDGIRCFVVSWKTENDEEVRTFLNSFPTGSRVYAAFNHEVEDDIERNDQTLANYRTVTARHFKVAKACGAIPTQIFMAFTLATAKRDITNYTVPGVEAVFFDAYMNPAKGKDNPEQVIDRCVAAATAAGAKETGLGETGLPSSVPEATQIALVKRERAKLLATPMATIACYWPSGDFKFVSDAVADAWFED